MNMISQWFSTVVDMIVPVINFVGMYNANGSVAYA